MRLSTLCQLFFLLWATLVTGGCGILFAPLTIPQAILNTHDLHGSALVFDENGTPLNDVTAHVRTWQPGWDPMWVSGGDSRMEEFTIHHQFTHRSRGSEMAVTFSKEGYSDHTIEFENDAIYDTYQLPAYRKVRFPQGNQPRIVLMRQDTPFALEFLKVDVDYDNPRLVPLLDLRQTVANTRTARQADNVAAARRLAVKMLEATTPIPPSHLWVVVEESPLKIIGKHNQIDPKSHHAASVTLHISGESAGFVPYSPHLGQEPFDQMIEAPADGYGPLAIVGAPWNDLSYDGDDYHYAYFRDGRRYGKIAFEINQNHESYLKITYHIAAQPNGTRDLRSRGLPSDAR